MKAGNHIVLRSKTVLQLKNKVQAKVEAEVEAKDKDRG